MSWMFEMNLPEKLGEEGQRIIDHTLLALAGLTALEYCPCSKNSQKAIKENLHFIGVHAGMKRFTSEERVMPSTFMAVCQYEFMMTLQSPFIKDHLLKVANQYGLSIIRAFRRYFELPAFEVEDDLVAVEVYLKHGDCGAVMKIEEVDKLDRDKYEVKRALPVNPTAIGFQIDRHMGFVNSCGDVSKTSERLKELLKIEESR